jgi:hypothetical protein
MHVVLQNFTDSVHVVEGVVGVKRYAQPIEAVRRNDAGLSQRLQQSGGIDAL